MRPTRFLHITCTIGAVHVGLVIYSAVFGGPKLPTHLNAAFFAVLMGCFAWGLHRETWQLIKHVNRRLDALTNQNVEHRVQLEEITGEIPKVRPLVTACHHGNELDGYAKGYVDGLARNPMNGNVRQIRG